MSDYTITFVMADGTNKVFTLDYSSNKESELQQKWNEMFEDVKYKHDGRFGASKTIVSIIVKEVK